MKKKSTSKTERLLIIPDTHRPFHDQRAWNLVIQVAKTWAPDRIIILGDFGDFYSVSSHQKNPALRNLFLKDEVVDVTAGLDELANAAPDAKKYYVQGNHEWRLERYIAAQAPDLFGCVDTPGILGLKERGWRYTPYKKHQKIGEIYFTHDTGKSGINAARQARTAFEDNVVIGHTHRMDYSIKGNAKNSPHVAAMFGWLGDVEKVDYMHNVNAKSDWVLGFGVGYMESNGVVHLRPCPIVEYKTVVGDRLYVG